MRARLERLIDLLRTGFWFVPLVMLLLACGLALGMLYLDERVDPGIRTSLAWAYSGGPEGARSLLSTIAGSMITAASVTFSLASVALSIASQQYGSRVLRNFMRDRITQVLLGTFVSTFVYSVLVVRAIRGSDQAGGFVPAISVTTAILLAVFSLMLLIYFIHHVSASIQASHIVKVIAADIDASIPKLYPSATGEGVDNEGLESFRRGEQTTMHAPTSGYLQMIDLDGLMMLVKKEDLRLEVRIKPGDHVVRGAEMAVVWGAKTPPGERAKKIAARFYFGGERTPAQDIRYQFQQLTDVVVRALSPGINDPFTAINGIDELTSGLTELARRPRVRHLRNDADGQPRLYVPTAELPEVLDETVGHIVLYAAADRFVMRALRRTIASVTPLARTNEARAMLKQMRDLLDERERREAESD